MEDESGTQATGRVVLGVCFLAALAIHAGLMPVMAGVFRAVGASSGGGLEVTWKAGPGEVAAGGTLPLELLLRDAGGAAVPRGAETRVQWSRDGGWDGQVRDVATWVALTVAEADAGAVATRWAVPPDRSGPGWLLARTRRPGGGWSRVAARALWIASDATPAVEVVSIDASDAVPAGGVLAVGYTLANRGDGWARGGVTDRVELRPVDSGGAEPWTVASVPRREPMGPGTEVSFSPAAVRLPADVVPGRYELAVTIGGGFDLTRTRPIDVLPATHPDLAVADLEAPLTVTAGRAFPLRFAVENRSPAATGPGLWGDRVYLSADDVLDAGDVQLRSEPRVKALAGFGAYASPEHAVTLDADDATSPVMYLIVSVDDAGDLDEGAFERNNTRARPVTVVHPRDADADLPELELGREDAPDERVTVAWIAYDDFQDLQARRSVTHQPAVQARVEPAPDAPLRSDASPDVAGPERVGAVGVASGAPPRPATLPAADALPPSSDPHGAPEGGGTATAGAEAQPRPQPADPRVTPPTPATPPAAAAATTPQPTPEPRPSRTPRSDREADPTAPLAVSVVRPGKVLVGPGLEVMTVRPRFSVTARTLSVPRNPEVVLTFDPDGTVRVAELRTSTGFDNIDGPLLSSLYAWTATGPRLAEGPEVRVAITILFREPVTPSAEPEPASGPSRE